MTPNEKLALEMFGRRVVKDVYDGSCEYLQAVMAHGMKGKNPDPLHVAYCSLDERSAQIVRRFVVEAVDQTFARFLHFLDTSQVPIPVELESGQQVDLRGVSDGLATEPYGEQGWIARFSRFKDGIVPI
jgi:hypothetical protein